MDFAKAGCFGGPVWEPYAVYVFITISVVLFAWTRFARRADRTGR